MHETYQTRPMIGGSFIREKDGTLRRNIEADETSNAETQTDLSPVIATTEIETGAQPKRRK